MANHIQPYQVSEAKPVRALAAVGVTSTVVVGALSAIPGMPVWVPPVVAVLGLGLTTFMGRYTEGQTTPWDAVAAKATPSGKVIAGPAAPADQPVGTSVVVIPAAES